MTHPGIVLVPHTHWDREWYEPFQVFRFRLVEALDQVLDMAEADPAFRFTLDGQTAAIEDYLEMRPNARPRVERAVRAGQLALGPWLILLDEFLCTGETIVRNLQLGWRGAQDLGGAMPVGYLPDMFGHIAQMPQILRRSGIEHAAFWRGVPGRVTAHAFNWRAPDGSRVRAEYLFDGYGNALDVLLVPEEIPRALGDYAQLTESRWSGDPILGLVGTDHMAPRPELMEWVRRFHSADFPISVATLDEYVLRRDDIDRLIDIRGELRSHARGNILPGVLSIRLPLKQAMALAERTVADAERVAASFSSTDFTPFLERAWRDIIESSAHDSVVGSGTDETVDQVAARLAESAQIARAVRDGVLRDLASVAPADATVLVNTLTRERALTVEVEVAAPDETLPVIAALPDGSGALVQELERTPTVLADEVMGAADLHRIIRRIHRRELFGQEIDSYEIRPGHIEFRVAKVPRTPDFDLLALRARIDEAASHGGQWRVVTLAEPRRRVLVHAEVPASGSLAVRVLQGTSSARPTSPIQTTSRTVSNGVVTVSMSEDGTFDVTGADGTVIRGAGAMIDEGDRGDSYNFGPVSQGAIVADPSDVSHRIVEDGPIRAVLRIVRRYRVPARLGTTPDTRSGDLVDHEITTDVEVRLGEPFARVTTSFINRAADHRVRLRIPLPEPVEESSSEGQFSVTARGLTSEGGWGEYPLPTFPATSFVSAGSVTALLAHATEYEVTQHGSAVDLTVLRSVGSISVNLHPLRDEPAASEIPIPGGQELGTHVASRIALLPHRGGWHEAEAIWWAEHFRADDLAAPGSARRDAPLPAPHRGISVESRHVQVSSVRRIGDAVEVRLVAMSPEPVGTKVTGAFTQVQTVDLLGRPLEDPARAAGVIALDLGAWEIRTLLFR